MSSYSTEGGERERERERERGERERERERERLCDVDRYHAEIASDHAHDYLDCGSTHCVLQLSLTQ